MVDTFLPLSFKALAHFLSVDEGKLLQDMNYNFVVKGELGMIAGGLSIKHKKVHGNRKCCSSTAKNVEVLLITDKETEYFDIIFDSDEELE